MANSAFNHEPAFTLPSSTTDNSIVRWDGTSGAGQQNSGVTIDDSNNVTISGYLYLSGDEKELRFYNGSNYLTLKASGSLSSNVTLTLPVDDGTTGQFLKTDGSGVLSWSDVSGAILTDDTVTEAKLDISNGPQNGYYLQTNGSGVLTWAAVAGGAIADTSGGADTYLARYTDGDSLIGSNKLTFTESSADFNINLSSANPYFRITSYSTNSTHEPYLELRKSGHGTIGSNTAMSNGEFLGTIAWAGSTASGWGLGAKIYVRTNAPFDGNQEDAKMYFAVKNGTSWKDVVTIADNSGTHPSYETEGVVGIGETSPVAKLHVKRGESGVDPYGRIAFFEDSGDECYIHVAGGGSSPTGGLLFGNGNGQVRAGLYMHENQVDVRVQGDLDFRIASSGNITGSHGTYHTSSDARVKENVVNSDVGLDILMQMRPVKFNFMENVGLGINTRVGFIAQEIESLVPEVVHTADTPHDGIPDMKAIEDMQLIPILVKAIQELNAKIEALS